MSEVVTELRVGHASRGEDGWFVFLAGMYGGGELGRSWIAPDEARAIAASLERQADAADAHNAGESCGLEGG